MVRAGSMVTTVAWVSNKSIMAGSRRLRSGLGIDDSEGRREELLRRAATVIALRIGGSHLGVIDLGLAAHGVHIHAGNLPLLHDDAAIHDHVAHGMAGTH